MVNSSRDNRAQCDIIWHVFIQFLATENALEIWVNRIVDAQLINDVLTGSHIPHSYPGALESVLSSMFSWEHVKEGVGFWCDLDYKWRKVHIHLMAQFDKEEYALKLRHVFSDPLEDHSAISAEELESLFS